MKISGIEFSWFLKDKGYIAHYASTVNYHNQRECGHLFAEMISKGAEIRKSCCSIQIKLAAQLKH